MDGPANLLEYLRARVAQGFGFLRIALRERDEFRAIDDDFQPRQIGC